VESGRTTGDHAYLMYEAMIDAGGFLPQISRDWFNA
jgi:hypothetical protein